MSLQRKWEAPRRKGYAARWKRRKGGKRDVERGRGRGQGREGEMEERRVVTERMERFACYCSHAACFVLG